MLGEMIMTESNVLNKVLSNGLCVGCGMCAGILSASLHMKTDKYGVYLPELKDGYNQGWEQESLKVCPFANNEENEDSIADRLFGN